MINKAEYKGLVSQIQHFSIGDGPGIRTTVFFQGCNLSCPWCHNPETIPRAPVLLFSENRCDQCGLCVRLCPENAHRIVDNRRQVLRSTCKSCGLCARRCPNQALQQSGRLVSRQQVMDELLEDADFYRESGGGVTFSGGEPLLQVDFLAGLAQACREAGLHVIIDTAGQVSAEDLTRVIPLTDLFFFDLKAVTEEGYQQLGGCLEQVMARLRQLADSRTPTVIRIPFIPGWHDQPDFAARLKRLLEPTGLKQIELLPYHRLGQSKYSALAIEYSLPHVRPPLPSVLNKLTAELTAAGFQVSLGG